MKRPMNCPDGICPTLRATYYKIGFYNVIQKGFPAVIESARDLKNDQKKELI